MSVKVEVGCLYSVTSGFYPDTCCDSFDTITDRSCLFHVSSSQHWYPRLMVTCCSQNECFFVTFMDYFFAWNFKSFHNGAYFDVTSKIAEIEGTCTLRSLSLVVFIDRLPEPPKFEGALEPNNLLQKSERIFENEISGPESIVVDGGEGSREFKSSKETLIKLSPITPYLLKQSVVLCIGYIFAWFHLMWNESFW